MELRSGSWRRSPRTVPPRRSGRNIHRCLRPCRRTAGCGARDRVPAHVGTLSRSPAAVSVGSRRTRVGKMPMQRASPSSLDQAHQLHADADAQHGLCERGITVSRPRSRSFAIADEASPTPGRITRSARRSSAGSAVRMNSAPGAVQGVGNRPQVARIVIDYRYHRTPLLLGMSYPKPCRPTAMRRARAKALKMASALWWSLSPRAEI